MAVEEVRWAYRGRVARVAMLAIAALVRGAAGTAWLAGQGVAVWPTPRAPVDRSAGR
ncbi:hypothetical protein V6U89_19990 [Micromonospora sp. CPCC 206171]|uniref:hypothetical protein n=1 Tax=Micromonospora sp. CPCC 206171 TaxID=3122405 RepID=UPI002FEEFB1C